MSQRSKVIVIVLILLLIFSCVFIGTSQPKPYGSVYIQGTDLLRLGNPSGLANLGWSGIDTEYTAGEALTVGKIVRLAFNGKVYTATANSSSLMPARFLVLKSASANAKVQLLRSGQFRDNRWSFTVGAYIYPSPTTAGNVTQTIPTASGHQVQQIGIAARSNVIDFEPGDLTVIELE
jgi:hypothetical protein